MPSWEKLIRPAIQKLVPFASARSTAAGGAELVYLDANENPNAADARQYNRYPNPQPPELLAVMAELYGVKPEQVAITLGGDSGIDHIIRTFCESGQDALMVTPPTFAMYEIWGAIQGAEIIRAPLRKDDLQLDLAAIRAAWKPNCKLLFLCTPNNPMGSLLKREDILALCKELSGKAVVIADEAYQEFSGQPSLIADLPAHDNLIVLRTLSKAYGLAGARCAALVAQPELLAFVRKVMAAYPMPQPTIDAAMEALTTEHRKTRQAQVKELIAERDRLASALQGNRHIRKILPSAANFLLLEVPDVEAFLALLRKSGVVARDRRSDWPNAVRLTVGTRAENDRVIAALGGA